MNEEEDLVARMIALIKDVLSDVSLEIEADAGESALHVADIREDIAAGRAPVGDHFERLLGSERRRGENAGRREVAERVMKEIQDWLNRNRG